jgi:hypothetical protein
MIHTQSLSIQHFCKESLENYNTEIRNKSAQHIPKP